MTLGIADSKRERQPQPITDSQPVLTSVSPRAVAKFTTYNRVPTEDPLMSNPYDMLSEHLEVDQKPLLPSRVPDMFSISDLTMVESTSTSSSDLYPFDVTTGSPPIPSTASDPIEKRLYLKHNFCQL